MGQAMRKTIRDGISLEGIFAIIPIELRNKHFVISKVFLFRGDYFSEFQKFLFLSIDIQ